MNAQMPITDCLWQNLVATKPHFEPLIEDMEADVCVIGAGYTGLSAALHLAEQGRSVCVLEAHHIGAGGSGRNVGLVNAGTWAKPDELVKILGKEQGEKLGTALGLAPKLVFDMIDKYQIDAQDTRTGNLHMAHSPQGERDIEERFAQLAERGANVALLTGAECHHYCGTQKIQKALLDRRAGTINPYAYVVGLAMAASRLGVRIFERSSVHKIVRVGEGWQVFSGRHLLFAKQVVIATNAYTEGEWTQVQKSFYLVDYYQIASKPLTGEVADSILPFKNGSWDTRMALSSIRRDKDGRLLLGTVGSLKYKPMSFFVSWANLMQDYYFPKLGRVEWQYQWRGQFGFTTDHIMRIFEPAPNIIAATGFNGRGITTGTLFGKAFADYLISQDPSVLPLSVRKLNDSKVSFTKLRSAYTEMGLTLYHAGQILRIIA